MGPGHRNITDPTPREIQVLKMIAAGLSTKQIAASLNISFKTAACHRSRLMDKLGIHEIAGLTRYAIRNGYVDAFGNPISESNQSELFHSVRMTYAEYKLAMDEYAAFLKERETIGLPNPDGSTGARRLREAEKSAYQKYHSALLAVRKFLIPDTI